jgi:hypothetical protein
MRTLCATAHLVLLTIAFFTFMSVESIAQDHCWIKYSYDPAGNRINREWWCGDPNGHEEDAEPKATAARDFGLRTMPNPASDQITLRSEEALDNAQVEMLDANGRSVLSQQITGTTADFDVSRLAPGLYTLRVRTESDEFFTTFSVVH